MTGAHLIAWSSGAGQWWVINPDYAIPAFILSYFLALISILTRVARAAFEDFPGRRSAILLRKMPTASASCQSVTEAALLAMIGGALMFNIGYYVFVSPYRAPTPDIVQELGGVLWFLAAFALGLAVYRSVSQLRAVSEMSRIARHVDIFKPAPTNAFSRLTAVGPIGLFGFVAVFRSVQRPGAGLRHPGRRSFLLIPPAASFVLPLRVMHDRLAREKSALQAGVQDRLKRVLERLHQAVDSHDMT